MSERTHKIANLVVSVLPVSVLSDNYAWFLYQNDKDCNIRVQPGHQAGHGRAVLVVDPGEAAPIERMLGKDHLQAILITHHHYDHVGGAEVLRQKYNIPVYGPENIRPGPDIVLKGGEILSLAGYHIRVLATPGHAVGHLSYFVEEIPALFSGDALFSGGCGRLFEGTAEEMFESLHHYDGLPDETLLCAGHEYTQANMAFIAALAEAGKIPGSPDDSDFSGVFERRRNIVARLRRDHLPTLPVTLGEERRINPFLLARNVDEFAELRRLKDMF